MKRALFCALLLASCRPPTPAEHTRNIKLVVVAATVECKLYQGVPTLPRDPLLDVKCPALLQVPTPQVSE